MKKTDLEKNAGNKINSSIARAPVLDRYGPGASAPADRREQRKLDQARGLIPFAVKLDGQLVAQLRAAAEQRQVALNDLVDELLRKGLGAAK